jgi:hypothetical protein
MWFLLNEYQREAVPVTVGSQLAKVFLVWGKVLSWVT